MKFKLQGASIDSTILAFVRFITLFIGIICTKIISVHFSLYEYGTYSQALLIITTITSVSILGLSDSINYFFNRANKNDDVRINYISTIFMIQYLIGGIIGIITLIFSKYIAYYFDNEALLPLFLWIAFAPMVTNLIAMLQVLYISLGKTKIIVIRNLIISLIRLVIFIFASIITKDIKTIIILTFICDVFQFFYFKIGLSKYNINISIISASFQYVGKILKYSIPMAGYIMLNTFMRDIDKLFISYMTDTEQLAIYTNSSKILPFDIITVSMATVLMPYITQSISKNDKSQIQYIYKNYLNFSLISTMIFVVGAVICSKELLVLLYDSKYLSGLNIFIIYLFIDLIRFANVSLILSASGQTKKLLNCAIFSLTANVILNFLLFNVCGLIGPAISTLIVMLTCNLYMMYSSKNIIGKSIFKLFDYKNVHLLIFEMLIIGFLIHYLNGYLEDNHLDNIPRFIICYLLFVISIGILNYKLLFRYFKNINHIKL